MSRPQKTPGFRPTRLTITSLVLLSVLMLLAQVVARPGEPELEMLPKHFLLHPGEEIHYNVVQRSESGELLAQSQAHFPDPKFSVRNPAIVRMVDRKGIFEAVKPGSTEIVVSIPSEERRFRVSVEGPAQPPINAVPYSTVKEIKAKEFVFVGHANRDGFDHTAVAKPGIDRLVEEAKKKHVPVVYWISAQYPDWYTDDRHPDYAIITEGQEHETRVDADRVTFTGGDFMFCTLRNVQMTLHAMLKHDPPQRINFVFPSDAIWVEDVWGPGEKKWYPAPMLVLTTLFARRANDAQRYDEVVIPFLDRTINQFPVLGYPRNAPTPPLSDLLRDWNIVVRFGERFERVYRSGDSNKTLLLEFQGL